MLFKNIVLIIDTVQNEFKINKYDTSFNVHYLGFWQLFFGFIILRFKYESQYLFLPFKYGTDNYKRLRMYLLWN